MVHCSWLDTVWKIQTDKLLPENAVINPGDRIGLIPPGGLVFPELGCRKAGLIVRGRHSEGRLLAYAK